MGPSKLTHGADVPRLSQTCVHQHAIHTQQFTCACNSKYHNSVAFGLSNWL